jgi:hypothetical protein
MSLATAVERAYEIVRPEDNEPLTNNDVALVHIALDPEEAKTHPLLYRVGKAELESRIDAVYVAAGAGNTYARFLIQAAALGTVSWTGPEAEAFAEPIIVSAKTLRQCRIALDYAAQANTPIADPVDSLALLDTSLGQIELIIEDFQRQHGAQI